MTTFGRPDGDAVWVVRPSAYAVIAGDEDRIAVVRTPRGLFLPGGGIDPGESPRDAIVREVREECGLSVAIDSWEARAVEFTWSDEEATHFEKRSTFASAREHGARIRAIELDHALEWLEPAAAMAHLTPPSHRWAVEQWRLPQTGTR